jgi:hypothetical protein
VRAHIRSEYLRRRAAQEEKLTSVAPNKTAGAIDSAMAPEYRRRLLETETERQFRQIWPAAERDGRSFIERRKMEVRPIDNAGD